MLNLSLWSQPPFISFSVSFGHILPSCQWLIDIPNPCFSCSSPLVLYFFWKKKTKKQNLNNSLKWVQAEQRFSWEPKLPGWWLICGNVCDYEFRGNRNSANNHKLRWFQLASASGDDWSLRHCVIRMSVTFLGMHYLSNASRKCLFRHAQRICFDFF